ncbi:alpha/beta hydrolase [Alphaproteobacteria bacterium]|nr:alpha/beta hydrolase [Alphaproteobacteria bacterium]
MTDNSILKKIIDEKLKNPYTENKTINQLREETATASTLIPLPENTKFKRILAGDVYAEWITCGDVDKDKTFMFIHGGGYYRGSIAATRATVARISAEAKVRCLSIEYRLAPEHPFPAAIYDTYTAYNWLIKEGLNPKNIIVSGQSAGGGLCLALLLKIKENNNIQPKGAVALSPWTDLSQSGKTMITNANIDPVISKKYLDRMANLYLYKTPSNTPLASPLYGDLTGLPPMLVQVGSAETMLDDSKRFVEKAKEAKVDVQIEVWKDMFHGWHGSAHILKDAEEAIKSIGLFCRKLFN